MDMITEEVKPKKKWQYVPGKNVRSHIAKWEAEDFAGQNAKFGGDAVGAKAKELQNLLGEDIGKRLTTKELDGLLATYYNLSPDSFKRVILPAVKEYAMDPTVLNSNKLYDTMMNRYKIAPAKYQKGIKRRAAADIGLMGIQRSEPLMLELTADGGKILTVDPSVYGLDNSGFLSTWKPVQSIKTDYNLNNTTPQSISAWSGADAPNATPRLKDFLEVRQEDLNRGTDIYGDPISPFSLRLRLPSLTSLLQLNSPEELAKSWFADALGISDITPEVPSLFPRLKNGKLPELRMKPKHKNGKLPRFLNGHPVTKVDLGSNPTNATLNPDGTFQDDYTRAAENGAVAKGIKPPVQYRSSFDPNAANEFIGMIPIVGDVQQSVLAIDEASNGNYGQAALLGAGLLVPNAMERAAKPLMPLIKKTPTTWLGKAWLTIKKPFLWIGNLFKKKQTIYPKHLFLPGENQITHEMLDDDLRGEINKYYSAKLASLTTDPNYQKSFRDVNNFLMSPLYKLRVASEAGYNTWGNVVNRQLDNLKSTSVVENPRYILYEDAGSPTGWSAYGANILGLESNGRVAVMPNSTEDIYNHEFLHAANRPSQTNPYHVVNLHNAKYQMKPLKPNGGFNIEEQTQRVRAGMMDMENRGYNYNSYEDIDRYLNLPTNELPDNVRQLIEEYGRLLTREAIKRFWGISGVVTAGAAASAATDKPGYKDGKSPIHIKPANRGKLTRLKKRTGKSEAELYRTGSTATRKMITFARNARKWKH